MLGQCKIAKAADAHECTLNSAGKQPAAGHCTIAGGLHASLQLQVSSKPEVCNLQDIAALAKS